MKLLSKISLLVLATALTFAFSGCKDSEGTELADLSLNFDFTVDGQALEYGKDISINGVIANLETAQYYVSGFEIENAEGTIIGNLNQHLLVKPNVGAQEILTTFKAQPYTTVRFDIGVQPEVNNQTEDDFTSRPADDPLAVQNPAMHWNWNSGYRFLRIDGQVDTDGDGTVDTPLAFHLGTDALLTSLSYNLQNDIEPGQNTLNFEFDLVKFFNGVDLTTETDTHTSNDLPLAQKVAANLATAISVQ